MIQVLIALQIVEIIYFINYRKDKNNAINKLHLECENYLHTLVQCKQIPKNIVEDKIKSMNKKYGQIKFRIR